MKEILRMTILFPVMWWTMKLQDEMCGEVLKMFYGRYLLMFTIWNLLSNIYKGKSDVTWTLKRY